MDFYSFKYLFTILTCIQLVNSLVQYWMAWYPVAYFICIMANYLYLGAIFAIFPTAVQNVFGLEQGPQIYVWVLLGSLFSSILNLIATQWLIDATSFVFIFYLGAGVELMVILVLLIFFKEEIDLENLKRRDAVVPIHVVSSDDSK